jgi:REP element-mobilizing transposase RayT
MSAPKRRLPCPPYNPGVRDLVEGKRAWDARANPADQRAGFQGWHERGYIPHRDSPRLTQFITWHLADAFPAALRGEWAALLEIEEDRERRKELEAYLDKGRGKAWLRRPDIAAVCEGALRHFDRERYTLKAWCLMPNHIHVLVLVTTVPMSDFVKSWKGYTARRSNQLLARGNCCPQQRQHAPTSTASESPSSPQPLSPADVPSSSFWAEGYWDTYMRDADQERRTIRYIENNPVKAGLARSPREWPWSSGRFRDDSGLLHLP